MCNLESKIINKITNSCFGVIWVDSMFGVAQTYSVELSCTSMFGGVRVYSSGVTLRTPRGVVRVYSSEGMLVPCSYSMFGVVQGYLVLCGQSGVLYVWSCLTDCARVE